MVGNRAELIVVHCFKLYSIFNQVVAVELVHFMGGDHSLLQYHQISFNLVEKELISLLFLAFSQPRTQPRVFQV